VRGLTEFFLQNIISIPYWHWKRRKYASKEVKKLGSSQASWLNIRICPN
jgi:hypothetical protein